MRKLVLTCLFLVSSFGEEAFSTSYGGDLARNVILAAREAAPLPLTYSDNQRLASLPETRFDCRRTVAEEQDLTDPDFGTDRFECFMNRSGRPLAAAASRNLYSAIARVFSLTPGEPVSVVMREWGLRLSESAPSSRFFCVAERL